MISVLLFCHQVRFIGFIASAVPQLGDITFFLGFLIAGACYLVLCRMKIATEQESS